MPKSKFNHEKSSNILAGFFSYSKNNLNFLSGIITLLPGAFYCKSIDGYFLAGNNLFLEMAGMISVIGKTDFDMPWSEMALTLRTNDAKAIELSTVLEAEELITLASGEEAMLLTRRAPLYDEEGGLMGIMGISFNITASKYKETTLISIQEQTQSTLENIVANMPGHLYWKNKEGVYLGCNDRQARSLGFQVGNDVIGKTDFDLPWGQGKAELFRKNDLHIIRTGETEIFEEKSQVDGKDAFVLSHKSPMRNKEGLITGVLGISIDISDRKQMEEELRKAKEQAEAASRAKTEFLANMSHDIRTPLTGVIGLSELLEQTLQAPQDKEKAHLLHDSGEELLTMLNDILDDVRAERLDKNEVALECFDLHDTIYDLIRLESPATHLKGLELKADIAPDVPRYIVSDHNKIQRILLNLVGNSIKFTQSGQITLSVELLHQDAHKAHLKFSVADTGIGIPEEVQSQIFNRFFKINSSYKGIYTGHGLGLHIVQSYVSLLGGHVTVTSTPGDGSVFHFDLECEIGSPLEQLQINTEKQSSLLDHRRSHLLIVEDNHVALKSLEFLLKAKGYTFASAMSAEDALSYLDTNHFDLIISDIGLPGCSGIEMAQQIRINEQQRNIPPIPIIGLTGHAKEVAERECLGAGMNAVFSKPADMNALDQCIQQLTKTNQQPNQVQNINTPPKSSNSPLGADLPATEAELLQLECYPLFDEAQALTQIPDKNLLITLMNTYLSKDIQNDIIHMQEAHRENNWQQIEALAHKFKGGVMYLGTQRMKFACQYLERYYKAGHRTLLEPLYQQLMAVNELTSNELTHWLQQQ